MGYIVGIVCYLIVILAGVDKYSWMIDFMSILE
jgi:hypothetical protein